MDEIACCERNSGAGPTTRPWDDPVAARPGASGGVWSTPLERSGRECRGWENSLRGEAGTQAPHADGTTGPTSPSTGETLRKLRGGRLKAPGPLRPGPGTGPLTLLPGSVRLWLAPWGKANNFPFLSTQCMSAAGLLVFIARLLSTVLGSRRFIGCTVWWSRPQLWRQPAGVQGPPAPHQVWVSLGNSLIFFSFLLKVSLKGLAQWCRG